jgi:hypothetical protein
MQFNQAFLFPFVRVLCYLYSTLTRLSRPIHAPRHQSQQTMPLSLIMTLAPNTKVKIEELHDRTSVHCFVRSS